MGVVAQPQFSLFPPFKLLPLAVYRALASVAWGYSNRLCRLKAGVVFPAVHACAAAAKQSGSFRTCENTVPVRRLNFLHINITSDRFPEAYISFFDSYKDAQRNLLASILLIQLAKSQCTERFGMAMSLCNDLTLEPNYNRPTYSHSARSYSNRLHRRM